MEVVKVPQGQTVRLSQRLNTFKVQKVQKPLCKVMLMGGGQKTLLMESSTLYKMTRRQLRFRAPSWCCPPDQTIKSIKN